MKTINGIGVIVKMKNSAAMIHIQTVNHAVNW